MGVGNFDYSSKMGGNKMGTPKKMGGKMGKGKMGSYKMGGGYTHKSGAMGDPEGQNKEKGY